MAQMQLCWHHGVHPEITAPNEEALQFSCGFILEQEGSLGLEHMKTDRNFWVGEGEGRARPEVEWVFFPSCFFINLVLLLLYTSSAASAENAGSRRISRWWSWAAFLGCVEEELQRQLGEKRNHCRHTCLGQLFIYRSGSHHSRTSYITPIISILWLKAEQ